MACLEGTFVWVLYKSVYMTALQIRIDAQVLIGMMYNHNSSYKNITWISFDDQIQELYTLIIPLPCQVPLNLM